MINKMIQWLLNMLDMSGTILKCPAESSSTVNVEEMSSRENKGCQTFSNGVAKCPAGNQNVWQSTECLLDKMSSTPKIILIITEDDYMSFCSRTSWLVQMRASIFSRSLRGHDLQSRSVVLVEFIKWIWLKELRQSYSSQVIYWPFSRCSTTLKASP